jgi:DNA-binding transcriptional MerR regulator
MSNLEQSTYSVGATARLTGLSPDVLRAWERRYAVVEPVRTEGGTRRYRASDLERLRLVKAAVDAGHRIGEVARLEPAELERRIEAAAPTHKSSLDQVMGALERLDGGEAERLISAQLAALGPTQFVEQFALPLVNAVGDGWANQRLCVASEHLGSALLRSLLGSALRPTAAHRGAPIIVFGTLPGERHEIGLLMAALTALGAGANPLYLGADLPLDELTRAVETSGAAALTLSLVALEPQAAQQALHSLRAGLAEDVALWVGGAGSEAIELPGHVQRIDSLPRLEHQVELLCVRAGVR